MSESKRICHVVSGDLWGGAEAQVYQLTKYFLDMNYQVYIITLNKGILYEKFCALPVDVSLVDENTTSLWKMVVAIRLFIKSNNINLIHCHGFKENFLAGVASKLLMGCKVVRTHHGRGVVSGSRAKAVIEKINAFLLTDILISVSQDLKNYLSSLGYPQNKIKVVRNGIDCSSMSVEISRREIFERYSIPDDSYVIGIASRIENEKGFEYIVLAVKELIEKGLPVIFVIVGTGNLQSKIERMAEDIGVAGSVIFTGFQKDVGSFLNIFDLYVMMSLNEGIPLALIEAMCAGKAVVCSEVGGIPEVVISDDNGILVPSMDAHSCAVACEKILSDKSLRKRLGENARKHVIEHFSARESAKCTIDQYESI